MDIFELYKKIGDKYDTVLSTTTTLTNPGVGTAIYLENLPLTGQIATINEDYCIGNIHNVEFQCEYGSTYLWRKIFSNLPK